MDTTLRAKIAEQLDKHYEFGIDVGAGRIEPSPDAGYADAAVILAMVAERLTSEAAALAAAKAALATETSNDWDDLNLMGYNYGFQHEWLQQARAGITAALTAAGITKGEGDA